MFRAIKNNLGSLCRAIRVINPTALIFIVNNVPNPRSAPVLGKRTQEHNKLLMQAVAGVNTRMKKVQYCDIAQHFVSQDGKEFIQPLEMYFTADGVMTKTGAFVYRASLFRELGIIPYSL